VCRALKWFIPRLSRAACVRLGTTLGALAFRFDRRGRAVAAENLACVFGDPVPGRDHPRLAQLSYENFARTMLDLFWAKRLTRENFHDWMKCEGFEPLRERLAREKRGVVLMCVHQGNWEWASLAFGFLDLPTTIVAENFKNARLTAVFKELREHSGHTIIPQESSLLRLMRTAKRGGRTGLLIDLSLRPTQAATIVDAFRGLHMCVPLLHAAIAQRTDALLVPVESRPAPDGTCRIIAHPPIESPAGASVREIAQRCWDAFEPLILAHPEQWLWPYKHFRFRPRDAARAYPAYANESGSFEKLRKATTST